MVLDEIDRNKATAANFKNADAIADRNQITILSFNRELTDKTIQA